MALLDLHITEPDADPRRSRFMRWWLDRAVDVACGPGAQVSMSLHWWAEPVLKAWFWWRVFATAELRLLWGTP